MRSPTNRLIRNEGFTLIEVVATILLLSILMAALSGLVPRFAARGTDREALQRVAEVHWARISLERLEDDLVNSTAAELAGNQLHLTGRLARDPVSGGMNDRSGECIYRFVPFAGEQLLIRQQDGRHELLGCGRVQLAISVLSDRKSGTFSIGLGRDNLPKAPHAKLKLDSAMRLEMVGDQNEVLASIIVFREPVTGAQLQSGGP